MEDLAVDGYNIKMDLKEVDGVVDWSHLAEDWDTGGHLNFLTG